MITSMLVSYGFCNKLLANLVAQTTCTCSPTDPEVRSLKPVSWAEMKVLNFRAVLPPEALGECFHAISPGFRAVFLAFFGSRTSFKASSVASSNLSVLNLSLLLSWHNSGHI